MKKSSSESRRGFFASLSLAFDIVQGSFWLLWLHPILVVPLLPVFLMVLGLEFGLLFVDNLFLALILIFVVAYSLMFSFVISSYMLQQIHKEQKPSLGKAISSSSTVYMIPKVFLLSLIWFGLVLIIVAIEMAINALLSRSESGSEQAEQIVDAIFGTVADALRMMGFMLIPIMIFEGVGLSQSFKRLKSTLQDSPTAALSGLALTKIATSLIFLIVVGIFQLIPPTYSGFIFLLGLPVLGVGWVFAMYLEQIFVTGLYLYRTFPESPVVSILLKKHLGRELPIAPVPEVA